MLVVEPDCAHYGCGSLGTNRTVKEQEEEQTCPEKFNTFFLPLESPTVKGRQNIKRDSDKIIDSVAAVSCVFVLEGDG